MNPAMNEAGPTDTSVKLLYSGIEFFADEGRAAPTQQAAHKLHLECDA